MPDESRYNLAMHRLERARECIKTAEALYDLEDFMTVANRAYYAIFYATRAVLALDGVDRKKHSGVISYFQQNYIKNGAFDKKYSAILQDAFEIRQESDYEDFYVISKEDVIEQLSNAKLFVAEVERHLQSI